MNIPLWNLAIAFLPTGVALAICLRWSWNARRASWAVLRMLVQLLTIGYLLTFLFESDSSALVAGIVLAMLVISGTIAVGSIGGAAGESGRRRLWHATLSIGVGGLATLVLVTRFVLELEPWYEPSVVVPLAGMIFANSMNAVSLAAERLGAELGHGAGPSEARAIAFNAALIPNINAMYAVGVVSLPGMMTGQILAGVSPLIAVRYQIVVMTMLFGASSVAVACFLTLTGRRA